MPDIRNKKAKKQEQVQEPTNEDADVNEITAPEGVSENEKATEETVEAEKVSENAEAVEKSEITPEDVKDEAEGGTEA